MPFHLQEILANYSKAEPKRASGGLYALAGFDYQIRLYIARLAESLAAGGDALEKAVARGDSTLTWKRGNGRRFKAGSLHRRAGNRPVVGLVEPGWEKAPSRG